jgi:3-hydroxybutyrate dehydrogenase
MRENMIVKGCDTGFGLDLAKHLHELGFKVFAGCLLKDSEGPGAKELMSIKLNRMVVLQLDVTRPEDWQNALQVVRREDTRDSGKEEIPYILLLNHNNFPVT